MDLNLFSKIKLIWVSAESVYLTMDLGLGLEPDPPRIDSYNYE